MQFPIVREYRTDILNRNPENEIRGEGFSVLPGATTRVIVPRHSPFFVRSLKLYFPNGQEMDIGVHFRIYQIMPKLTGLAAEPVACFIELLQDNIIAGTIDYDVVGEFSLFDNTMMYLIMGAVNDDRPIDWVNIKNKPVVFPPTLHTHSLMYDILAFQEMIELLNMFIEAKNMFGRPLIQLKIETYFNNFIYWLNDYRNMLTTFLNDHIKTYNEHGLTDVQVGLEKVDNFATAVSMGEIMSGRNDLHLTVNGLRTIVEQTGFDANELLAQNALPIAQYGNSNFIPPSIDGSFEGLGGVSETAGICMESDGVVVLLSNRMDGRVSGLYFSSLKDPFKPAGKLTYTSYKYTHQRFIQDGANVDRIVQGSGSEVILVGNNKTNHYYIGLTSGTLDPSKHVYSRLNITPILNLINPGDHAAARNTLENVSFGRMSIAYFGEWIYVFLGHSYVTPGVLEDPALNDSRYRSVYRVRTADVVAQLDVTLVQQTVSFQDIRGVQHTNVPNWQWCVPVGSTNGGGYSSYVFDFSAPPSQMLGCYRSQQTVTAAHRDKPGVYLVRFTTYYYAQNNTSVGLKGVVLMLEVLYEFDPSLNAFTKLKNTPLPYIDWNTYQDNWVNTYSSMVAADSQQGLAVLEDGGIIASGGGFNSFPRFTFGVKPSNTLTRYETMERLWYNELVMSFMGIKNEAVVSPLESSIKPRSMLFTVGGEFYTAAHKTNAEQIGFYYKAVSGRLTSRPEVTNLLINNVVSQPLTNNIKRVNATPRIGGAVVSVPSAQLATYGMDVGDSAFCMGVQGRLLNIAEEGGNFWGVAPDIDAVRIFSTHDLIQETNGTVSIYPVSEIVYPKAIVDQLKTHVEFPTMVNLSPVVPVTITDPTGRLTDKFGWLPVVVTVSYVPAGTIDHYITMLTIVPTYAVSGNVRTVTGFTVLDVLHRSSPGNAPQVPWSPFMGGATSEITHGSMRTGYYLDGNALSVVVDTGVVWAGIGDAVRMNGRIYYPNRSTQRWDLTLGGTFMQLYGTSGFSHFTVTPDNGIVAAYPYDLSTGGAATIYNGSVNNPLLASVYPEVGWVVFFQTEIVATFNGKTYTVPSGNIDLRDFDPAPFNKEFYIYVKLESNVVSYDVSLEKRLETPFLTWVARVNTNDRQIITIERYNVYTINGNRVSEIKRGNSIPASSGMVNTEGQLPWLRSDEMLP